MRMRGSMFCACAIEVQTLFPFHDLHEMLDSGGPFLVGKFLMEMEMFFMPLLLIVLLGHNTGTNG